MNRLFNITALSCAMALTLFITGCQSTGHAHTQTSAAPTDFDASVEVVGMSCPQCANTLKLIMDKDDGIASSTVDLGGGKVYMQFEKGKSLSADAIKTLVTDSGFTAGKVIFTNKGGR